MDEKPTLQESLILHLAKCPPHDHRGWERDGNSTQTAPFPVIWGSSERRGQKLKLGFAAQALDIGVFRLVLCSSWQWYPGWRWCFLLEGKAWFTACLRRNLRNRFYLWNLRWCGPWTPAPALILIGHHGQPRHSCWDSQVSRGGCWQLASPIVPGTCSSH